jgi:hypothetical protein
MPDPSALLVPAVLLAAAFVHGVFGFGFPMLAAALVWDVVRRWLGV